MKKKVLLLAVFGSLLFTNNAHAEAVVMLGGKLDNVISVGAVGSVAKVLDSSMNVIQFERLQKSLSAIKAAVQGKTDELSSTLQEVLKYNNTALIESMKDIEKAKMVMEAKKKVNSVSKDLCDEPGISAGLQTAMKAGNKVSKKYQQNMLQEILKADELFLKKKVAELKLEEEQPERGHEETLTKRGKVHFTNETATNLQNFATMSDKDIEKISDPTIKLSMQAKKNETIYQASKFLKAEGDRLAMYQGSIDITPEVEKLLKNINLNPKQYEDNKLSIMEFLKIKSSQYIINPDKIKEDITSDTTSSMRELIRLQSYQMWIQLYQTQILERIQTRILSQPSETQNKQEAIQI